ncbi:MAG: T9SS type A sorting domain-containing protein [Bacteroidota bacterium]
MKKSYNFNLTFLGGIKLKQITSNLLVLLCFSSAVAQPFVEVTGTGNPLDFVALTATQGPGASVAFADLNNDGISDAFIGIENGTILFLENTGTASNPIFGDSTGTPEDPVNGLDGGNTANITFADLDDDDDLDLIMGIKGSTQLTSGGGGRFRYYKNEGTPSSPNFVLTVSTDDPFDNIRLSLGGFPLNDARSDFVDIDGDSDLDLVAAGGATGVLFFYRNTGTSIAPVFTEESFSPINGRVYDDRPDPTFFDYDGDTDFDMVVGFSDGTYDYFENTGTPTNAVYTRRNGSSNPWNGVTSGNNAEVELLDTDGDGDLDFFSGTSSGIVIYHRNDIPSLPVEWLYVEATRQGNTGLITWATTEEVNNQKFVVERSVDGTMFETLAELKGSGTTNTQQNYEFRDVLPHIGKSVYRVKQVDFNGQFDYSDAVELFFSGPELLNAYPNPTSDIIYLNISLAEAYSLKVSLFDATGRQVIQTQTEAIEGGNVQQLDLSGLNSGIYLLKVNSVDQQVRIQRQIVKQ